jgi:hypothetical protein
MKRLKKYTLIKAGALLLSGVYFFIVTAHLFFAPKFQFAQARSNGIVVAENTQTVYLLVRTSRCEFNDNKTLKNRGKTQPEPFILLPMGSKPAQNALTGNFACGYPSTHFNFSYLSNRVLRI